MNQRFLQHLTFLSFYLAIPLVNAEVFVENMAADIKTEQTRVEGYGSIEFLLIPSDFVVGGKPV